MRAREWGALTRPMAPGESDQRRAPRIPRIPGVQGFRDSETYIVQLYYRVKVTCTVGPTRGSAAAPCGVHQLVVCQVLQVGSRVQFQ